MPTPPAIKVYIRNRALQREAELDQFGELELIARFNAVGSWRLLVHDTVTKAHLLDLAGYGIEVTYDGATVLAGPATLVVRTRDQNSNQTEITGADDTIWLTDRWGHAAPTVAAPPYSSQASDVRTGLASTVLRAYVDANLGPGALTTRQVPGVVLAADPLLGITVTGRARFPTLLEHLQSLAISGGDLGFRLVQVGTQLQFQVYQPVDRAASVRFSLELGNLAGYTYQRGRPEANYILVGGSGEGTARTFKEGQVGASVAEWGRIEGPLADRRDTADPAELAQEITERLAEGAAQTSLSISPVDTDQMRFGTHYNLGDRVSAVIDGAVITEVIREVKYTFTAGHQRVEPQIGAPNQLAVLRVFRYLRDTRRRVSNMERR